MESLRDFSIITLLVLIGQFAWSQEDSTLRENDFLNPDLIEDFVADGDNNFEYDAFLDALNVYRKKPLNLNKATSADLSSMRMLSPSQVDAFIAHRARFGDFISIYELQVIPGFSPELIRAMEPFVKLSGDLDDYGIKLGKMITTGTNELFLRWNQFLPRGLSYELREDTGEPLFEGNPHRYYLRYRHSNSNKLSYGFTAEKDPGEAFFKKSNKQGFDFYSAHFYMKNYKKWLKSLAIGDFRLSMGQGLIFYSGFGARKGGQVIQIKRGASGLAAFRSVDENNYLRGGGAEIEVLDNLSIMAFGSVRKRDANQAQLDEIDDEILGVTSLLSSGLHRTANEIEDEKSIDQYTTGGFIKYELPKFKVAANVVHHQLSIPLELNLRPYNQFYFQGDKITNASFDYRYQFRNINVFGEWALSSNGGTAYSNGLIINLNRIADIAVLNRNFSRDYQTLNPAPFAETSAARNERGTYIGFDIKPNINWQFSAYYDLYEFNWLRFSADGPSNGQDFRGRLTYRIKRKLETYLEYRQETKQNNLSGNNSVFDVLVPNKRVQARWHFQYDINKALRWRSRFDWGFSEIDDVKQFGTAVYQDFIYKPINFPLSFTSRLAFFDTESYAIRFYSYENNLLGSFSIPAYFGKGMRYYLNLRYRGIRNVTLEARYAQTLFPDAVAVLSTEGILLGNVRRELGFQMKLKF